MTDEFHFMTDKFHFMTEPTKKMKLRRARAECLLNERSFSIIRMLNWWESLEVSIKEEWEG